MVTTCFFNENTGLWEPCNPDAVAAYVKIEKILDDRGIDDNHEFWDVLGKSFKAAADYLGVTRDEISGWLRIDADY